MLLTSTLFAALAAVSTAAKTVDYKTLKDSKGNGIPDFSFAGYHSSSSPLPDISSKATQTLSASSGDQTKKIQDALNSISQKGGGVLLLSSGNYTVSSNITIPDKTVLRGSGIGKTLLLASSSADTLLTLGADVSDSGQTTAANITNSYVPVGASSFNVSNASKLKVSQDIYVQREVTKEWVAANGMDKLVRDGQPQTWIAVGTLIQQPRKITAINSNSITIDIPLTDQLDSKYMTGQVATYSFPKGSTEVGLENLSIYIQPSCAGAALSDDSCIAPVVNVAAFTQDSWVRNLQFKGSNQAVSTEKKSRRITIDSVTTIRDHDTDNSAGYAFDFLIQGCQILVSNCQTLATTDNARSYVVVTGSTVPGPNVVRNYHTQPAWNAIQPHQRWAHGLLAENSTSGTQFINRGTAGSGHGWTINTGVSWNNQAPTDGYSEVDSPPLGTNWDIGSTGPDKSNTTEIISKGAAVQPTSLFAAQLSARGISS